MFRNSDLPLLINERLIPDSVLERLTDTYDRNAGNMLRGRLKQ